MTESAPTPSRLRRFATYLVQPIDPASVAMFRILFGVVLGLQVVRYLNGGYILRYYTQTEHHFRYYGFDWVRVLDLELMYGLFLVCGISAFMLAAGFFYRVAAPLFFLTFTYGFLLDQTIYLNHMYLVCLYGFLLCLVPAHRAWSVDALVFRSPHTGIIPRWGLWILTFQMACVYFYGAIAKINRDWLLDAQPLRIWIFNRAYHMPPDSWLRWEHTAMFMSWSGFLIDLLAVPFLLWKRTRLAMLLALVAFHLANKYLFNIGIFPWLSLAATTLFLAPSWPRMLLRLPAFRIPAYTIPRSAFVIPILLVPYVLLQLLVPLRHHLYPSNVAWSEEGHRFAWRMKLRSKVGHGYLMVQTEDQRHIEVMPFESVLEQHQVRQVLNRPDMILQLAHRLAREEEARLGIPVQVFAHVTCQLNHHRPQLLVDPSVDLAREPRNLLAAHWIMPFEYSPIRNWQTQEETVEEEDLEEIE